MNSGIIAAFSGGEEGVIEEAWLGWEWSEVRLRREEVLLWAGAVVEWVDEILGRVGV